MCLPDITVAAGADRFSESDERGARAGIISQVLLTMGMIKKRGTRESCHSPGAPGRLQGGGEGPVGP